MIVERILNERRVLHESDAGRMIRQRETGTLYENAEDNLPCQYTYEETETPIPTEGEADLADYEAALKKLGVSL